ncbi:hypothetical protein AURDEDRAFT_174583 [Auricularia subglabra TFB-10046 SS5]|uniref:Uncharacterized protein n=1 Tax=Auricularia subglabra (strain TFB-10046 / SS5) TaxID=717982 RepID=J0D976_AURST|nr:hypothetical protein AURDEDRAFT_174583 [Auricularia subglabra TFB-10046 SS5]
MADPPPAGSTDHTGGRIEGATLTEPTPTPAARLPDVPQSAQRSQSVALGNDSRTPDVRPSTAIVVLHKFGTAYANACCLVVNFDGPVEVRASIGTILSAALKPSAERVGRHLRHILEFYPDAGVHSGTSLLPDTFDITAPRHDAFPLDPVSVLDSSAQGYLYHGRLCSLTDPPCEDIVRMLLPPHRDDVLRLCIDVGQSGDIPIIPILIEYRGLDVPFSPMPSAHSTPAAASPDLEPELDSRAPPLQDAQARISVAPQPGGQLGATTPPAVTASTSLSHSPPPDLATAGPPRPAGRGAAQRAARPSGERYVPGGNPVLHALVWDTYG